jgi:hypothetical protein
MAPTPAASDDGQERQDARQQDELLAEAEAGARYVEAVALAPSVEDRPSHEHQGQQKARQQPGHE